MRSGNTAVFPLMAGAGAALFGLVHVYWLLGGGLGLPGGQPIYDSPLSGSPALLIVIDVLAIPLSAAATLSAVALAGRGPWRSRPRLVGWAWVIAGLCVLHAAPTVPDWFALVFGERSTSTLSLAERFLMFLYEPVFMAGGVGFALAALHGSLAVRTPVHDGGARA